MKNSEFIKRIIFVVGILIAIIIMVIVLILIMSSGGDKEENTVNLESNTSNEVDNAVPVLSSEEVQAYNSKFNHYIGSEISGTEVKSLIDVIMASNTANADVPGRFIAISYKDIENYAALTNSTTDVSGGTANDAAASGKIGEAAYMQNTNSYVLEKGQEMTKLKSAINEGKKYSVSMDHNENGLIKMAVIRELKSADVSENNTVENNIVENNTVEENTMTNTVSQNEVDTNTTTNTTPENNTVSPVDQMQKQEIEIYNAKIKAYVGNAKAGVEAKSLIDTIISMNNMNAGTPGKFIAISFVNFSKVASHNGIVGDPGTKNNTAQYVSTQTKTMTTLKSGINSTKKYDIEAAYDASGYIVQVKLTEK